MKTVDHVEAHLKHGLEVICAQASQAFTESLEEFRGSIQAQIEPLIAQLRHQASIVQETNAASGDVRATLHSLLQAKRIIG